MKGSSIEHILDHMNEAHILVERDTGQVIMTNPAAKSIYGLSESVLRGSPDARFQCIHDSERVRVRSLYERLQRHGPSFTIQYRVTRPNGTVIWVEEHSRIVTVDGKECLFSSVTSSGPGLRHWGERQLLVLSEIAALLSDAENLEEVAEDVLSKICSGFNWDIASIWSLEEDGLLLRRQFSWPAREVSRSAGDDPDSGEQLFLPPTEEDRLRLALNSNHPLWITDLAESSLPGVFKAHAQDGQRTCACLPISYNDTACGMLVLLSSESREIQHELLQLAKLVALQFGPHFREALERPQVNSAGIEPSHSNQLRSSSPTLFVNPNDGRIEGLNQSARELFAVSPQQVIGKSLDQWIVVGELAPQDFSSFMQNLAAKPVRKLEGTIKLPNEQSCQASIELGAIPSITDTVAVLKIYPQLSCKAAEVEQPASSDEFQIVAGVPCAIAFLDNKLRFTAASDRFLEKLHLSRNEILGRRCAEILTDFGPRWETLLERSLSGEHVRLDEEEYRLPSGTREWISWQFSPKRTHDGVITGIAMYARLMTSEHRSQQSLKRAERKYRALFDNMLDGFAYHRIIVDAAGEPVDYVFLEVNRSFEQITGLKRSEIVGRRVTEVLPQIKNDNRDWITNYGQVAMSGGDLRFEDYSVDLGRWFAVSAYSPKPGYFVTVIEDITKRKIAELELIEAGRTISTLLSNLPGMAYRCLNSPSWEMEYVSDGVLELTGYEADDLLASAGVSYSQLIVEEDRDYVWEEVQAAIKKDRPFRMSYRIRTREGEVKWVWEQGCAIKDENDELVALEGFITDITERKRAEETLRSREEFYHELIDQSSDIFTIVDATGNFIYVSTSIETTLGYDPESMIQTSSFDYIHQEDLPHVKQQLKKLFDGKIEPTVTHRFKAANGEWRLLESKIRNLLDNPHVRGIVINSRDVTERSKVELELMKLATAVEQAAEAIIITDTRALIQYVNPAFEQMSGYDRNGVIGQNPRILRSGENSPNLYREMWERLGAGLHWVGKLTNRRRDGKEYQVESAISPMKNENGEIINFVAVQRDITKEVELESQLRQAQKLEAVGRLASGIAHDFNNLLAGIRGFAELIALDVSTPEKLKSFAEEIITAAGRAADLTGQLLAFARQGNYLSVPVDIHTIITEVVSMLHHTMEKNIRVETQLDADSTMIKGDPSQIQSAILNLAVNARDAMPQGGSLTIRTENREVDAEFRGLHDLSPNQTSFVAIEVIDTGEGIPPEQIEHIFEPFFTTKPQGEGTGLGLAGVYGCVKNHNGGVFVKSQPGSGSTFTLLLPTIDVAENETSRRGTHESAFPRQHVAVVDDEHFILKFASHALSKAGFRVTTCSSGEEFLKHLNKSVAFDVAIVDVVMPGLSGQELFIESRKLRPDLPVLLMSGYSDATLHKSLEDGAAGFIPKPVTAKNLVAKVREVLESVSVAAGSALQPSSPTK